MLQKRRHRLDRLASLRYHHKLVLSVLIVFGILATIALLAKDREILKVESEYPAQDARFPDYVAALAGAPRSSGNTFEVLRNGDAFLPAMLHAIARAGKRVVLETYIYNKGVVEDEFTDALEAAARRGVQVRVTVDALGSVKMSSQAEERFQRAGVTLGKYGPPKWYKPQQVNYRTHRKVLVVDGREAFVGGAGIADHWLGNADSKEHWRDTMVRVEGPLARDLEAAFNENYMIANAPAHPVLEPPLFAGSSEARDSAFAVRSSPTGGSNDLKRVYMLALASARKTLDICTPYFLLDGSSKWEIEQAAARGVRIRVLVEGDQTDARVVKFASRHFYQQLLDEGVQIYEYQPTMMHAKYMVVDGVWSMFGSANFDNRSLELNNELNVAAKDRALAARLTADFEDDLRVSKRIEPAAWGRRGFLERARERFWGIFGEIF